MVLHVPWRRQHSALACLLLFASTNAWAEVPGAETTAPVASTTPPHSAEQADTEAKATAAALFDEGAALYARAEYERAAESFLAADALVPSSEALQSAIASARKAQLHLLVVRAAERAILRASQDPALADRAHVALAEAETHLARVHVSCSPGPCVVFLDGLPLDESALHLAPGSYRLSAQAGESRERSASGAPDETFTAVAGAEYVFTLDAPSAEGSSAHAETAAPSAPEPTTDATSRPVDEATEPHPGLPPWAFYGGVAASGVLAIATTWSGLDALDQRGDLPSRESPDYDAARTDVYDAAGRTDILLVASLLVGAGTAALGAWWTDWGAEQPVELGTSLLPGGASLGLRGRFD